MAFTSHRIGALATLIVGLGLMGCAATDPSSRDRSIRGVRGDSPPQPLPALAISDAPSAALPASRNEPVPLAVLAQGPPTPPGRDPGVKPATYLDPDKKPTPWAPPAATLGTPATPGAMTPRQLYDKAAAQWKTIDSYIVRLRRREIVGTKAQPEELMVMKYRQQPQSVYFKWVGDTAKGRECVYAPGRYEGKIQTKIAAGDVPILPAGMRFATLPDDPRATSRSRYPITDAGFGNTIARFGKLVVANERGDTSRGALKYLGQIKRPEFQQPVEAVLQIVPAGGDPRMMGGGQRLFCFDQRCHMPMLVVATDEKGREAEYYCYDRFEFPVHLDDNDFNPDVLWRDANATKARGARP